MTRHTHDYVPFGVSVLGGFLVCLAISMATGRKEAWDSDHVRRDLCHRLPLSRSPLAVGHKYGCGPGIRTRTGWKFAVAVAALSGRHDGTFRPPVRRRFVGKQTGDKEERRLTRRQRPHCISCKPPAGACQLGRVNG